MKKSDEKLVWLVLDRLLLHSKPVADGWKSDFKITFTDDEREAMIKLRDELKK